MGKFTKAEQYILAKNFIGMTVPSESVLLV